jgi:cytochrome c peroxidase
MGYYERRVSKLSIKTKNLGYFVIVLTIFAFIFSFGEDSFANRHALPEPTADSDFYDNGQPDPAKVELGKLLFFDKVLSGNRNISCATCHHPLTNTGDGLSLPVGEGGRGLGVAREPLQIGDYIIISGKPKKLGGIRERVPRNAPPIWNLGAKEFVRMFHDGRVEFIEEEDRGDIAPSFINGDGFKTPAGDQLPLGLDNVFAAQAMFPVTSLAEMAGQVEDQNPQNEIAYPAAFGILAGPGGVWDLLAQRLRNIPEYVDKFIEVFADVNEADDITYVHAANAIAAFEASAWRMDNSPFDRYLRGEKHAMSEAAKDGMELFYGKAKCNSCHSGIFQTDHLFHAICMPQIGPGRGGVEPEDIGRGEVVGFDGKYKFRTPSLRNTVLNGPWGHDGAYNTLKAIVHHHLNPTDAYDNYDRSQAVLPSQNRTDLADYDFEILDDQYHSWSNDIKNANELDFINLSEEEVQLVIEFLNALTDPAALDIRKDVPFKVPSRLTVAD